MSMLTKAFVVLASILSVVLVALFASYVATTEDLRGDLDQMRAQHDAARAQVRSTGAELTAAEQRFVEQMNNLRNERQTLAGEIDRLQAELARVESELAEEQARLAEFEASVARLSAAGTQNARLLEQVNNELQRRRDEAVARQRQIIEYSDRIAELESESATQIREVRRLRQDKVAMQETMREMQDRWSRVPEGIRIQVTSAQADRRLVDPPDHPIIGQVTRVMGSDDELLVQVDVGDRDGVVRHLPFMVYRGNEFIGMLQIEQVDTAASVGRMTLTRHEVRTGDRVYVGPELAARDLLP